MFFFIFRLKNYNLIKIIVIERMDKNMTYETYCEMTDVLQESINNGSITMEAADELNNIFYENYVTENALDDNKAFINACNDANKKYKESVKNIKKSIKAKDAKSAEKALNESMDVLKELRENIQNTPSTLGNTSIAIVIRSIATAISTGLALLATEYAINKNVPGVIVKYDKKQFMAVYSALGALRDIRTSFKNKKDYDSANPFKKQALDVIDKNLKLLFDFKSQINKIK